FEDISKATRISLPSGVSSAALEEVHITFIHKANQVTNEQYSIEVYDVASDGSPGNLLGVQFYSYQFVNADEDLGTPAFTTFHLLTSPITVPAQFFISIDLGNYDSSGYQNIAIASTDYLGSFVDEDWEQLSDGSWVNMSESWFDLADDGWLIWMEAVVDINTTSSEAPTIQSTAIGSPAEGSAVGINASITSPNGISAAALAYLQGGSSAEPTVVAMNNTGGNNWQANIPESVVNLSGFQYAVGATDNVGISSTTDVVNVNVSTEGIDRNLGIQGSTASDYRLFSIPINLTNNSPGSVLQDDLGTYDPAVWRLFGLNANQTYDEFPSSGAMRAGAAFWLASADVASINTGPGTSTTLSNAHTINLNPGWTFIGTPFNYAVSQNQLQLSSNNTLDIRAFNGSWGNLNGALQPFAGYAIAATAADELLVFPFPVTGKSAPVDHASSFDWSVQIQAAHGDIIDNDNVAAVAAQADSDWDLMDRPEPPVIGSYISLYFPHEDWDVPFKRFNTDVRPASQDLEQWTFEVASNINESISLSFDGLQDIPESLDVWLVDNLMHREQDLRINPAYAFQTSESPHKERFSLWVGKSNTLRDALTALQSLPERTELQAFPNPFSSLSTLRVGLKSDTQISLSVFDSLGKRVATLLSGEEKTAGFHTVGWEGKNDAGQYVASGVYFYVLQTGSETVTKQVVHLR
ncbi:unnamed protein product, partial [Laminaria digitata]